MLQGHQGTTVPPRRTACPHMIPESPRLAFHSDSWDTGPGGHRPRCLAPAHVVSCPSPGAPRARASSQGLLLTIKTPSPGREPGAPGASVPLGTSGKARTVAFI